MSKKRIVALILCGGTMLLGGCGQLLNAQVGMIAAEQTEVTVESTIAAYEITDIDRKTQEDQSVKIDFTLLEEEEGSVPIGCSYEDGVLEIQQTGSYELSGKSIDGQVVIRVYDDEIVHLILNGVELTSTKGPALYVERADKVVITLKEGTSNIFSDSPEYATDKEACIFSNTDLTINGAGELGVYGYYRDAVRSKDRLKVIGSNIYVRAKNDGLRGNDGVLLSDSNVSIESERTGIRSEAEMDFVVLHGGTCKVISGQNAVAANSYVLIKDCEYDLYAVEEAVKCSGVKEIDE